MTIGLHPVAIMHQIGHVTLHYQSASVVASLMANADTSLSRAAKWPGAAYYMCHLTQLLHELNTQHIHDAFIAASVPP